MPTSLSSDRNQHQPVFGPSLKTFKHSLSFVDAKRKPYNVERKFETSAVSGRRDTTVNYRIRGEDFDIVIVLSEHFDRINGDSADLYIGTFKDGRNSDIGFDSDTFTFDGRMHQKEMAIIRGIVTGDNALSEIVKAVRLYLPELHYTHIRFNGLEDGYNHDTLTEYHNLIDRKHGELSRFKQMVEDTPIDPSLRRFL